MKNFAEKKNEAPGFFFFKLLNNKIVGQPLR